METVTVSSKYQIVIPSRLRESMNIKAGQKIMMVEYDGRIEMILVPSVEDARGMFRGIGTNIERERKDRV